MPSRKKLQGQYRKAKRATAAAMRHNTACDHLGEGRNWSRDDWNAAGSFWLNCVDLCHACHFHETLNMYRFIRISYDAYKQLNDIRKKLFRRMMLSHGTAAVVSGAEQIDLTKESRIDGLFINILMILVIEVRDKYGDGDMNDLVAIEIRKRFDDIIECPRATVRFFHRRNSCDCLKEIYYNLKESTKRKSYCWKCYQIFDIRTFKRCVSCNVAQYCSYDCAMACWQQHRNEQCKVFQTDQPKEL